MPFLRESSVDLIILDKMMLYQDGVSLCRDIRQQFTTPLIMLTAVVDDIEHIVALESGANDYLNKPFNPRVLLARIRALLQPKFNVQSSISDEEADSHIIETDKQEYHFSSWRLNLNNRLLYAQDNTEITLSNSEYSLLLALVTHPNRVLSREQLLDMTNKDDIPFDRSIDVVISRLRRKFSQSQDSPPLIKTIRQGGYFFAPQVKKMLTD
ncbi:MAG: response regulator transcription factor [Gammaproteobacteria bacterium]|nr:response regulator transcription factor [Gammaproteobacteria bacterium]